MSDIMSDNIMWELLTWKDTTDTDVYDIGTEGDEDTDMIFGQLIYVNNTVQPEDKNLILMDGSVYPKSKYSERTVAMFDNFAPESNSVRYIPYLTSATAPAGYQVVCKLDHTTSMYKVWQAFKDGGSMCGVDNAGIISSENPWWIDIVINANIDPDMILYGFQIQGEQRARSAKKVRLLGSLDTTEENLTLIKDWEVNYQSTGNSAYSDICLTLDEYKQYKRIRLEVYETFTTNGKAIWFTKINYFGISKSFMTGYEPSFIVKDYRAIAPENTLPYMKVEKI